MSNQTLFDAFQHWLQGQINAATTGYASRIERLETTVSTQAVQIEILSRLMQRVDDAEVRLLELGKNVPRVDELRQLHNKLACRVQDMLVPQTMDADALLDKIRNAEDWTDIVVNDLLGSSAFAAAVQEEVFDRTFDDKIKEAVQDLNFSVHVR